MGNNSELTSASALLTKALIRPTAKRTPAAVYRALIIKGLPKETSLALVALEYNLPTEDSNGKMIEWTLKQIEQILFLAWCYKEGKTR